MLTDSQVQLVAKHLRYEDLPGSQTVHNVVPGNSIAYYWPFCCTKFLIYLERV